MPMKKTLDEILAEARRECEADKLKKKKKKYSDDEISELIKLMKNLDNIEEER